MDGVISLRRIHAPQVLLVVGQTLPSHSRSTFFLELLYFSWILTDIFFMPFFLWLFSPVRCIFCPFFPLGLRFLFWSVALLLALACSAFFVSTTTIDFLRATIVTSLDTQNVPLSEVFFPSVVVCNLNQVLANLKLLSVI